MAENKYVISKAVRDKFKVTPITDADLKKFSNLSLELFTYLKEVKALDFKVYFRVDMEMIEFITPRNFAEDLVEAIISARNKEYSNLDICVERKDYPKFELLIQNIRQRKIENLLKKDPNLDRKTIEVFGDLSQASQMIVRGGINKTVAQKAQMAASRLIDNLLDSEVAVGTLSRMILADETLYDHSAAVAMIAGIIARNLLGKSKDEAEQIARSGLYHDVGKTCVPGHILNKPGKFTPEEFEIIKGHTSLGYDELKKAMANGAPIEEQVALVALEHHEKFKGGGYPMGKSGRLEEKLDGIHEYARIVTIADVYSALLMKRVYKEAYDQEKSLTLMRSFAPNDYDPAIWDKFEKSVTQSIDYYAAIEKASDTRKDHGRIIVIDENGKRTTIGQKNKSA
ncbi:HD-GYP domain-containing protein [Oligoflexus tunisiensis]|uniref:HD-GYP domain-containing protein n=1 Tax=Oligoflexus tunisiensis TaxID=708132 RepID=UPI00114D1E66|nr:HD domain-containing phosphohydrolase [Oligoflexus tunisiensis]